MTERYDEEEAALEELERSPAPGDVEAAEADALEQATPAQPSGEEGPERVGERPEADALEQARDVDADDELDERR